MTAKRITFIFIGLSSLSSPGCSWFSQAHSRDTYPGANLALFSPAEVGQVFTMHVESLREHLDMGTIIETVRSVTPAIGNHPATHIYSAVWHLPHRTEALATTREEVYPNRIVVDCGAGRLPQIVLHTPLRVGTTWHIGSAPGEEDTYRITAIRTHCTSWGSFPNAVQVTTDQIVPLISGGPRSRFVITSWFAKGYGLIEMTLAKPGAQDKGIRHTLINVSSPAPIVDFRS